MAEDFTAQLKDFERLTIQNMKFIAINSIQDVMEGSMTPQLGVTKGATSFEIGKIPVAESELINSLTSEGVKGKDSYVVAIAGLKLTEKLEFVWTAPHALSMEFGYKHKETDNEIPGRHFVGHNAEKFSEHVARYEKEFKV